VTHGVGVTPELPAGNPGVTQRIGHAVLVPGLVVDDPCFVEIGEGLTGTGGPLVGHAYLVEGFGLAAPVGQRPAERRGVLGQRQRRLVTAGLLAHLTQLQRRLRDPGLQG
jgi:hypothetical protein